MPNQQAVDERPDPPIQEPELDTESKQGNILPGFNKDFQMLLFLRTVRQNPNRTEAQSRRCCHCEERYATKQSLFSGKECFAEFILIAVEGLAMTPWRYAML